MIGGQTINLGGSGDLAFSNITGNLNTVTQIVNGNIANAKLANSNIVIGGQTINLGGSGNIRLSNLSDVSISGAVSNNSILKYNSSVSAWQTLIPQNICLIFPNTSVNVGSTTMNQITLSNIGNLQYYILTSNEAPTRAENSTIFRFTGFTNNYYNISSQFTYQRTVASNDSSFSLIAGRTNAALTTTPNLQGWTNLFTTANIIGVARNGSIGNGYGSASINSIVDFTNADPIPNVEIRFVQDNVDLVQMWQFGSHITINKIL